LLRNKKKSNELLGAICIIFIIDGEVKLFALQQIQKLLLLCKREAIKI